MLSWKRPMNVKQSIYLFWSVWLCSLSFDAIGEGSGIMLYQVIRVQGVVLTREPLEPVWVPVKKGMYLKEGQLIQTTEGASIALEGDGFTEEFNSGGLAGSHRQETAAIRRKAVLKIATPMIVRVQRDLYRKVKVARYFIEDVPAMATLHRPKTSPLLSLADAWNRVAIQVKGGRGGKSSLLKLHDREDEGVDLETKGQKIQLLSPPREALMRTARLPLELQLAWSRPTAEVKSYLIYLWKSDAERPAPMAQTDLDYYSILIPSLGEFLVQITSLDGTWQTEAHSVRVVSSDIKNISSANRANQTPVSGSIRAIYPPKNLTLLTPYGLNINGVEDAVEKMTVLFQWRLEGVVNATEYDLVVVDANGRERIRISTNAMRQSVSLPAGEYSWWVEAPVATLTGSMQEQTSLSIGSRPPSSEARLRSESRQLSIVTGPKPGDREQWVRDRINEEKPGTIYLTDGL